MAMAITVCRFCLVVLLVASPGGWCAPRSKSSHRSSGPQTVYDQKQTGDYNVQLHLKDFQIIALLADDSFGGDYDYNYDYSDFTLKPSTQKPSTGATSPPHPQSSTPLVPEKPSSTSKPTLAASISTSPSKEPPKQQPPTNTPDQPPKEASKPNGMKGNSSEKVVEIVESSTVPQGEKLQETNSPGQIKVQIIETPVGIVPGEVVPEKNGAATHAEVLQIRRCAHGFARDKKGRCRRVRRPGSVSSQIPYGFGRLANNFASRLKYASSEESSESDED